MNTPDLLALSERFKSIGGDDAMKVKHVPGVQRSGYTRLFLNDQDQSKYDDGGQAGEIIYKSCAVKFKTKMVDDEETGKQVMKIEGWASTKDLDLDNEIIKPSAFKSSLETFLSKGRMLFMHDWWAVPVGKWTTGAIKTKGLYVEGFVIPTSLGKDVQIAIEFDAIDSLSVGFRTITDKYDYDDEVRTILDLELLEVSIVSLPANPNALLEQAKTHGIKSFTPKTVPGTEQRKVTMAVLPDETIAKLEAMTKGFDPAEGTIDARLASLKDTVAGLQKNVGDVQEQGAKLKEGLIGEAEFKAYVEKRKEEFTGLITQLGDIQAAVKEKQVVRYAVKDWRGLFDDFAFLKDEDGKALPRLYQSGYKLMNLPVDYDATENGWLVKAVRNLNDSVLFTDAMFKGSKKPGYRGVQSLKSFHVLADVIDKHFDQELGQAMKGLIEGKAMAVGNTGYGAEWVPSLMSGELETLFRLRPSLVNYVRPTWQMPSATARFPIMTGAAVAYLADEATTNSPKVLTKTELATSNVLFSTRCFAAAIPTSRQLIEDTIIDLISTLREELVTALMDAEEAAVVNGDNSATHMDTGLSLVTGDDDVRVAYQGLRKIARGLSNTWDSQSTSLGDKATTFTAPDVRYNRQLLGVLGIDPSQCLHVASIAGYYQALSFSQVTKANEFGAASTWLTGKLPALDGVEIYISSKMRDDLNAAGIYDGSTTGHTSWLTLHRNSFMPGERRGVNLEFKYDPEVQQSLFIATMRRDFKNIRPASQLPVSEGYNIEAA